MGSGGSAVDAMVIGCLGVERRAERFFSYLAISDRRKSVYSPHWQKVFTPCALPGLLKIVLRAHTSGTDTKVRAVHRNDGHVGRVKRGFTARNSPALRAAAVQGTVNQGHDQGHEGEVGALGMASAAVPVVMALHFCVARASASALGSRCSLRRTRGNHSNNELLPSGPEKVASLVPCTAADKAAPKKKNVFGKMQKAGRKAFAMVCLSLHFSQPGFCDVPVLRFTRTRCNAGGDVQARHSRVARQARGILEDVRVRPK